MAAPKGHPRYGGRTKGVLNRKTKDLIERCEEKGVDPFDVLLELCKDQDKNMRFSAAKELCQYIHPKRKALEVTGGEDKDLKDEPISTADLLKLVKGPA